MITEYFSKCMTVDELEKEHRRLVLQMHPDRNPDNPNATADFQEMQSQYEERLAELHGDYTKAAKGRARREQAEREQAERERKERERDRLAEVIAEARRNKGVDFHRLDVGQYIYARKVKYAPSAFEWDFLSGDELLHVILKGGTADETVVKIERVFDVCDEDIMRVDLSNYIDGNFMFNGSLFGGWETIQTSESTRKGKRVAKVVMIRSEHYCFFGNPKGDRVFSDYYVPINYEDMFSDRLHVIAEEQKREKIEQERKDAELKAKMQKEQQSLIDEWSTKLIQLSAALTFTEQCAVAKQNWMAMLKAKFPGAKFKVTKGYNEDSFYLHWTDGPKIEDVKKIDELFESQKFVTPWQKMFGRFDVLGCVRSMSTIVKARILSDLTNVDNDFHLKGINDEVTLSPYAWELLHLMVGKDIHKDSDLCPNYKNSEGGFEVKVDDAIQYVFYHTSYVKPKKTTKKRKAKVA